MVFALLRRVSDVLCLPADVIPVLELLDMHGVKRSAVHLEIADALRTHLLPRLATLPQARLEGLLQRTFQYISIDELQAVPMAVMMRLDAIGRSFLEELCKYPALYEKAPMKIKRQIWAINYELFRAYVDPTLGPFLQAPTVSLEAPVNDMWGRTLEEPRQRRRATPAIGAMLACLDKSRSLYKSLLEMCKKVYAEEGNSMYCALRADVLMALHDNGVTELYQHDPLHELCWILDAGTRERSLSEPLLRDLGAALQKLRGAKSGRERADQAMLLASPPVFHALLRSLCTALMRAVAERALPADARRCPALSLLAKLVARAASARDLLLRQGPLLAPKSARRELLAVLCPWLAARVAQGLLEERGSPAAAPFVVPEAVAALLSTDLASRKVLQAFVVMRVEAGEPAGLSVMLAAASLNVDLATDADFVQSLVTALLAGMRGANSTTTKVRRWREMFLS
jgi:hypothetical protein